MNILIIEDNPLKREKINDFISSNFDVVIDEAASYNSGLSLASNKAYQLIVLDMSMPTFDRTESAQGGRFRAVAGKEIAFKLKRIDKLVPFVVVTGYSDFSVDTKSLSIEQIHDLLTVLKDEYKGYIFFDSAKSYWKDQLSNVISSLL